jgi:hypothetical protein
MVKLSRTSLGFLARASLAGNAGTGAAGFTFALAVTEARLTGFASASVTALGSVVASFLTLEATAAEAVPAATVLAAG